MSDQTPAPAPLSLPDKPNLDWLRKNLQSPLESLKKMLSKRSRNVLTFDAIEMSARGDSWLDDTVAFA